MTTMTTSRVGRKPVTIPPGVDVKLQGRDLLIKGPKGQMTFPLHPYIEVNVEANQIKVRLNTEETSFQVRTATKMKKSIVGTARSKISNVVQGVTAGFETKLVLIGVGYRAQAKGNTLALTLGFSHPVNYKIPTGITIETPSQTEILIKGIDKHLVGHTAATIRAIRAPEPYKGKGVRRANEKVILKETKKK